MFACLRWCTYKHIFILICHLLFSSNALLVRTERAHPGLERKATANDEYNDLVVRFSINALLKKAQQKATKDSPLWLASGHIALILSPYAYEVSCRIRAVRVALPV